MELEKILKVAIKGGASDIILKTGAVPRFRHQGMLISLSDGETVSQETMSQWINQILPKYLHPKLSTLSDMDFGFQLTNGQRFRVNVFRQQQKFGMVLRIISNHIRTLEELQLPAILTSLTDEKRGLILITGATGCGKSTTLAAMIQRINMNQACHIVTIEDPIEFCFKENKATVNQREIGLDTDSFHASLRSALRQNPDVILVGELRDKETIETTLMAAETGHLVLSTLHTLDAVESLTRLMSYFPPHQHISIRMMLAHTLKAVISQRLVQRVDGKGRVAAMEVLICNSFVRDVLLKGKDFETLYDAIKKGSDTYGMQSFDQSLMTLYRNNFISKEEVIKQATSKQDMELELRGIGDGKMGI